MPCNSSWPSLRTGNAGADAPLVTGGTLVLTRFSHTLGLFFISGYNEYFVTSSRFTAAARKYE